VGRRDGELVAVEFNPKQTPGDVDARMIEGIRGIFLGGTSRFKATAGEWCRWAHEHHLLFHYGRAGTEEKVRHALDVGADSLDSAFPMWTLERFQLFVRWVHMGPCQGDL